MMSLGVIMRILQCKASSGQGACRMIETSFGCIRAALPRRISPLHRNLSRRLLLLLLLGSWFNGARAEAEPLFAAAFFSYDVGERPGCIATADLNGDGRSDLVVIKRRQL